MSTWIEKKYIGLISTSLDRFKKVDETSYNFRCPFCGDSKKNKYKARGYIFISGDHHQFKCHNCGVSYSFNYFLKLIDPSLYKDFRVESLKDSGKSRLENNNNRFSCVETSASSDVLGGLKRVIDLPPNNPVRTYVSRRQLPTDRISELYYSVRFMEWINTLLPNKFSDTQLKNDEPRLVIPFVLNGRVVAVTGRSFKNDSLRYITIKLIDDVKVYGMEHIDPNERVYVLEGPLDSMFIKNSIAMGGADVRIDELGLSDVVFVFDNEPRNREIVARMEKLIAAGHKVCVWPSSVHEKDINDMILAGRTPQQVTSTIDKSTYSGARAKLEMARWKR